MPSAAVLDFSPVQTEDRPLDRDQIVTHPLFWEVERQIARHLIDIHIASPRLSRLKASHRKWLMTHSLFALSLQRTDDDPLSGLTASRFIDIVMRLDAASRNTASAFLAELVAYKFLRDVPHLADRRVRVLETTPTSYDAMASWFRGHMACLDRLDGGAREQRVLEDPRIFRLAQPRATETLVNCPLWRAPADSIGSFLWSDYGGMVLHDLIARLDWYDPAAERVEIEPLALSTLSERYTLSSTNLKRMFKKSEDAGLIGWQYPRRRGRMWFSGTFLADYFTWQSAKFSALDEAFHWACAKLEGQAPDERAGP